MGIRIRKHLGYGTNRLKYNKEVEQYEAIDPHVDMDKLREFWHERGDSLEDFLKWAEENKEGLLTDFGKTYPTGLNQDLDFLFRWFIRDIKQGIKANETATRRRGPGDCIIYDGEYGNPRVLLIQPPDHTQDWSRYDNIIDYYDAGRVAKTAIKFVGLTIYPHEGRLVRFRDPPEGCYTAPDQRAHLGDITKDRVLDDKGIVAIRAGWYNQLVGRWAKDVPPAATGKLLTHLKRDFRPHVPPSVVALMKYTEAFHPDFINRLRPMLYTYWG